MAIHLFRLFRRRNPLHPFIMRKPGTCSEPVPVAIRPNSGVSHHAHHPDTARRRRLKKWLAWSGAHWQTMSQRTFVLMILSSTNQEPLCTPR
jgi:hypothetical protein